MYRTNYDFDGIIKEHSGWLLPLATFLITASLAALVFAYYFGPSPTGLGTELPAPIESPIRVTLSVGDRNLRVPANFLPLASTRSGGTRTILELMAVLPDFGGYSSGVADAFHKNTADSPLLYISLKTDGHIVPEEDRYRRIYVPQLEDETGGEGPSGLRQFSFRLASGYRNEDLFLGTGELGMATILCDKPGPDTPSPNCFRDYPLSGGMSLSYRFKRAHLAQWATIDKGVRTLLAKFEAGP